MPGRIIVVAADPSSGPALTAALETVGTVVDSGDAELYVVHLAGAAAAGEIVPKLPGTAPVIVVWPGAELVAIVDLMQTSDRVAGALIADPLQPAALAALAARLLTDDVLGPEASIAALVAAPVETCEVADYQDKARCLTAIAELAERTKVPTHLRASIEQCVDEMLMNALYDAPLDADGEPLFAGVPTRTRITLKTDHKVTASYTCDGKVLAVAVRDAFGSLGRHIVLRHLYKGLHVSDPVERKAGGAGLGLYLMVHSATAVYFHVLPKIATEAICVFDVARPEPRLEQFGVVVQRDARDRVPTGPARRLVAVKPPLARRIARIAAPLLAVAAVAAAIAFWPHHAKPAALRVTTAPAGATVELDGRAIGIAIASPGSAGARSTSEGTLWLGDLASGRRVHVAATLDGFAPAATDVELAPGDNPVRLELAALPRVELDTLPAGAIVTVDGTRVGTTPLVLTAYPAGSMLVLDFELRGYRSATSTIRVPGRLVIPLSVSEELVRVHVVSDPPGAAIVETGTQPGPDRTYTPADIFVAPDHEQRLTLVMPKHAPLVIPPFTVARGQQGVEKGGPLPPP